MSVALTGCLEQMPKDSKDNPSNPPVNAKECLPGEDFTLAIDSKDLFPLPKGLAKKINSGKDKGRTIAKMFDFFFWYVKWIKHQKSSRYGHLLKFPMKDHRIDDAQFNQISLTTDAVVFDADEVRWERLLVGLNGIKGSQVDPSAVQIEILNTVEFDSPLYLPPGLLRFDDVATANDLFIVLLGGVGLLNNYIKKNPGKFVRIDSYSHVRITMDLKKFSFGQKTAGDLVRRAAHANRDLHTRLKHLNGWLRVTDGKLTLAGSSAGNCPDPEPNPDTTPPTIRIDSQSVTGISAETSQSVTFSADEPVAFTCSFNQEPFQACSLESDNRLGSWTVSGLDDGTHHLRIRAQDVAGNIGEILQTEWTVDTTAPVVTLISANPSGPLTSSTSMELRFSVNEAAQLACSVDGGASFVCSSPLALSDLSDGPHRVEVVATDLAQLSSSPLVYEWSVQSQPPSVIITKITPSHSPIASDSIAFEFEGASGTTGYLCTLDSGIATECASPMALSSLTDGSHLFEVRAVDGLGRAGDPASYAWTVDTLPPEVFLTSVSIPRSPTNLDHLELSFSASESATFSCAIDGDEESTCQSPLSLSGLSEGEHRIRVWARDTAGNRSASPLEYIWMIDQTAPIAQITNADPSGAIIGSNTLQLTLAVNEAASFECRLDEGAFSHCSSPARFEELGDGSHTIEVRAVDEAGNIGPVVSHAVTVDTKAPGVQITVIDPEASPTNVRTRQYEFGSNEESAMFECSLDGAPFTSCTTSITLTNLSEGPHTFAVRAVDLAGNISGEPAVDHFVIDLTAPETTITSIDPSDNPLDSTSISISFASNESGAGFECSANEGAPFAPCASPFIINNLADGPHSFQVRAVDQAGNADATPATHSWTVDTSPLIISNLRVVSISANAATVTWTTSRPAYSQVEYLEYPSNIVRTTVKSTTMQTTHSVRITGLSNYTQYYVTAIASTARQEIRSNVIPFRSAR